MPELIMRQSIPRDGWQPPLLLQPAFASGGLDSIRHQSGKSKSYKAGPVRRAVTAAHEACCGSYLVLRVTTRDGTFSLLLAWDALPKPSLNTRVREVVCGRPHNWSSVPHEVIQIRYGTCPCSAHLDSHSVRDVKRDNVQRNALAVRLQPRLQLGALA